VAQAQLLRTHDQLDAARTAHHTHAALHFTDTERGRFAHPLPRATTTIQMQCSAVADTRGLTRSRTSCPQQGPATVGTTPATTRAQATTRCAPRCR
jgi:hypothetical protein